MITVVSGIRDLHHTSRHTVEHAVREELQRLDVTGMRFGGAIGVDTVALLAAAEAARPEVVLEVVVPWTLSRQPVAARKAVENVRARVRVTELHLTNQDKSAFLRRNDLMLFGASVARLLAFTDGRATGGTHYTICGANLRRLDVRTVTVKSESEQCERCKGFCTCWERVP